MDVLVQTFVYTEKRTSKKWKSYAVTISPRAADHAPITPRKVKRKLITKLLFIYSWCSEESMEYEVNEDYLAIIP